ncbi:uncharacterized protein sync [Cyclopterus lumpus]|uniref:uncharacterized protein sync n=1 Tax=Cyclopterus lumpus TaxID=8103 RepID=UPI00148600D5|nr:uncharacterized protein sync [Cyclopterus lumpus]
MEDGSISSGFGPLFIREEDVGADRTLLEQRERAATQSGLAFKGTRPNQPAFIKPYLQEMDELLKGCEELIGVPFGSHFSASHSETRSTEDATSESYGGTSGSTRSYLSTSYMDTHMDGGAGTDDRPARGPPQILAAVGNKRGGTSVASRRREMPLTSAGNKLSETMVEYEGQLLGMLAMLESSMEESGMDYEPQGCAPDASQEYVHIGKNPRLHRGTTPAPAEQGSEMTSETQAMCLESRAGPHAGGDEASRESRNEATTVGSAMNGGQQNGVLSRDNVDGFSMKTLEWQDPGVLDAQLGFSGPSMPSDGAENDPMRCEATKTGCMTAHGGASGIEVDDAEELKMDTFDLGSGANDLGALGCQMEKCIEEVQRLERRRKELLTEVLEMRGAKDRGEAVGSNEEEEEEEEEEELIDGKVVRLMNAFRREEEGRRAERKKEIQSLREERAEEERMLWKVNLERQGLHEELRRLKRRLFTVARDCAHNQAALNTQHREVELLMREEEKLQTLVLQLTEEGSRLRAAQQQQLLDLQVALQVQTSSQTSNTQDELTECRRHSCGDVQQYLQGGLKALEDRYEPVLLTLLKRREATAAALLKAKEHARELRAQLRPLKEEIQRLTLQRARLEEKLKLIHWKRREDVGQYKETVSFLEDSSRVLKTELRIQKRNTKEIEELRDSLNKQLLLYRAAIEEHNKSDDEENTIECS